MLLALAIRSTLLLVLAFAVNLSLRRASAAIRHLVWTAAFACLLALPLLQRSAPHWPVTVPSAAPPVLAAVMVDDAVPPPQPVPRRTIDFSVFWSAGVLLAAARLLAGFIRLRKLRSGARRAPWNTFSRWTPDILESDQIDLPITFGILRPTILFPPVANNWPPERLRLVLAHELAHVRRLDCLTQLLAEAMCALYWFNPLVWITASQARKERERACDDAVLNGGIKSSDYAEHLLGVVKSVQPQGAPVPMAISISSHDLQERLKAVLKPHVSRRGATPKLAAAILVLALSVLVPIATMRAQDPAGSGALAGSVLDASGAAIPHATVTAKGLDTHNREVTYSGDDGTYAFRSLPAGRYTVEVRARGFALYSKPVTVAAGQPVALNPGLNLGDVSENIDVVGQKPSSSTSAVARIPQRVRVGGNVQATKLTYRVPPVYPEHAKQNGIQGVVVLQGVIGTSGNLLSLEVMSKSVDPELAQAARDAVSQWRYEPTLLNGQPVEVITSITVNFRLE